jgi:dephospho-CoA kinase
VIAVLAPMELRKSRIIARDALSEERAMARLNIQKPDDFYTAKAEYVVINDGDQDALIEQVSRIVADLGVLVI